jgi:hypothetical protein
MIALMTLCFISQDLYSHQLDTQQPRTWRVHTGKGSFFLVLHVAGPVAGEDVGISPLELTLLNTDTSLLETIIDLNFGLHKVATQGTRNSKVLVFRFCVQAEQPSITLKLDRFVSLPNQVHKFTEKCGYVCGFEVIMDTTDDSLWWINSDFYSQNATEVEDVDEHEAEMDKCRRAAVRTSFEIACTRRMVMDGTREGIVNVRKKSSRIEARYKAKHISFNPSSRMLTCYAIDSTEVEWVRQVSGRASIDQDHPETGFKVATMQGESIHTVLFNVEVGQETMRDEWIEAINTKTGSGQSPSRYTRRYSSSDLMSTELEAVEPVSMSKDDTAINRRCQSEDVLSESDRSKPLRRKSLKSPTKARTRNPFSRPAAPPNSPPSQSRSGRNSISPRTKRASADDLTTKRVHSSRLAPPSRRQSPTSPSRRKSAK